MRNLKRLGASVTLLGVLSLTTLAGETMTPPCANAQVTVDDPVVPGTANSAPASSSETEYSIAEATVDLLMNVLFLF